MLYLGDRLSEDPGLFLPYMHQAEASVVLGRWLWRFAPATATNAIRTRQVYQANATETFWLRDASDRQSVVERTHMVKAVALAGATFAAPVPWRYLSGLLAAVQANAWAQSTVRLPWAAG